MYFKRLFFILLVLLMPATLFLYGNDNGWSQSGVASWYGGKFQGRLTANGEIFDTNKMTAAHKKLAFNSIVRVTNTTNGQWVDVRINDRGPFVKGRIIDLSFAAACKISMTGHGVADVTLRLIKNGDGKTYHHEHRKSMSDSHRREAKAIKKIVQKNWYQVGAFSSEQNARKQVAFLKLKGISSEWCLESSLYKVGVPVNSAATIKAMEVYLKSLGYKSLLLRSRPGVLK